jgi:hypothetical protein
LISPYGCGCSFKSEKAAERIRGRSMQSKEARKGLDVKVSWWELHIPSISI